MDSFLSCLPEDLCRSAAGDLLLWKFSITGYRIFLILTLLIVVALIGKNELKVGKTAFALPMVDGVIDDPTYPTY